MSGRSLERLYRALEPLRLYGLRRGGRVDCELAAYGAGFARLEQLLEEIGEQAFVQTARGEGLRLHERLVGLQERPGLDVEARRELVLYRLAVAPFDFHLRGMHGSVLAAGIEAEITEHLTQEHLTVRARRRIDPTLSTDGARLRLRAMLPAHLEFYLDVGELTWDMLEAAQADWGDWDALDFTWEAFDWNGHVIFGRGERHGEQ